MKASLLETAREGAFLRALDRLALVRRRPGAYEAEGGRRGRLPRASGIDWIDHRPYAPGDDLRYLDWHLFARLGRPFVRRFASEHAERADILVDCSRSMTLGSPPKLEVARALAFAIGYVALTAGERVGCAFFAERLLARLPGGRGEAHRARLFDFLRTAPVGVTTALGSSLGSFAASASEVGQAIVLSDLLDPSFEAGLAAMRSRGFEVAVLRLRSSCDEEPEFEEDVASLVDIETGARREVALGRSQRERYFNQRAQEAERTARFCARAGITLAMLRGGRGLRELVFEDLRRSGLLS
jgi:uncharacterized protein (DUF58 family)